MAGPLEEITKLGQNETVQNVVGSCSSLWCLINGFLLDLQGPLSVISIIVGILVGVSIIALNVKKFRSKK